MNRIYTMANDMQIAKMKLVHKMICSNKPSTIIGFNYTIRNEAKINEIEDVKNMTLDKHGVKSAEIDINYKLDGLISIKQYLKRKVLSENQILDLFINMLEAQQNVAKLYIDSRQLSFCADDIYIDTNIDMPKFLYVPLLCDDSLEINIAACFRELIYKYINAEDGISSTLKMIIDNISEVGWHIRGLYYKLLDLRRENDGEINLENTRLSVQNQKSEPQSSNINSERFSEISINYKDENINENNLVDLSQNIFDDIDDRVFDDSKLYEHKTDNNIKVIILLTIIAIIIGAGIAFLWMSSLDNIQKIGIGLMAMSIGGIVYKKINTKKLHQYEDLSSIDDRDNSVKSYSNEKNEKFVLKNIVENNDLSHPPINKTVMMPKCEGVFFLKSANGDEIHLLKERIIVGRDKESVDIYLDDNPNVGRHHAELIRIKNGYAIKDLKSINGTYVGKLKVKPTEAIALFDGDQVKFANLEYTYHNWSA